MNGRIRAQGHDLSSMRGGFVEVESRRAEMVVSQMLLVRPDITVAWPASDGRTIPMVWRRQCPLCGRWLEKREPHIPWMCQCGWRGGL